MDKEQTTNGTPEPERWRRVEELFEAATASPPGERTRSLRAACGDDGELFDEVRSLLDADDHGGAFMSRPALGGGFHIQEPQLSDARRLEAGTRLGAYRVTGFVAAGGMGAVYEAERADRQFEKRVAIKVIKRGLDTDEVLRRFRAERRVMASLDHVNIAGLMDAGATDDGPPYLVMEFVDGTNIARYCATNKLSVEQRLCLFLDVCAAVKYAHQHLVVHRDIKPSNILVTSEGVPKLLDFGIAKVLNPEGAEGAPTNTSLTSAMLTPEYASPEQLLGERVTTQTDIYSLGVVLFEMLTGEKPYVFESRSPRAIERVVCSSRAVRASATVRRSGERDRPRQRLARYLAGDLDHIIMKAMRQEPHLRYGTVDQLAEDIRRHLDGRVVSARAGVLGYGARRFIRRHRFPVVTGVLAFGLLGALAADRTAEARRSAREIHITRLVNDGRARIMKACTAQGLPGRAVITEPVLERECARMLDELAHEPMAYIGLLDKIAELAWSLGFSQQEVNARRQIIERKAGTGATDVDLIDDRLALTEALAANGEWIAAYEELRSIERVQTNALGPRHPDVGDTIYRAAKMLNRSGTHPRSEVLPMMERAVEIVGAGSDPADERAMRMTLALASTYLTMGPDWIEKARPLIDGVVNSARAHGANGPLWAAMSVMVVKTWDYGRVEEAWTLFEAMKHDIAESRAPTTAEMEMEALLIKDLVNVRSLTRPEGTPEMTKMLERANRLLEDVRKERAASRLATMGYVHHNLAKLHTDWARYDRAAGRTSQAMSHYREAEAWCRRSMADYQSHDGRWNRFTARPMTHLGKILVEQGRYDEAIGYLRDAYEIRSSILEDGDWKTAKTASMLGDCLRGLGEYEEARRLVEGAYDAIRLTKGEHHYRTCEAIERIIRVHQDLGNHDQVAMWRARLPLGHVARNP